MSSDSLLKTKVILCKVCGVMVPRRKEYHPKICEACQKFFRRNCSRHIGLLCSGGSSNCAIVASSRRCCPRCRFQKCLSVGMQSKLLLSNESAHPNNTSEGTASPPGTPPIEEQYSPVMIKPELCGSAAISPPSMSFIPQLEMLKPVADGTNISMVMEAFKQICDQNYGSFDRLNKAPSAKSIMPHFIKSYMEEQLCAGYGVIPPCQGFSAIGKMAETHSQIPLFESLYDFNLIQKPFIEVEPAIDDTNQQSVLSDFFSRLQGLSAQHMSGMLPMTAG